jgi:NADPH:quinone reductase
VDAGPGRGAGHPPVRRGLHTAGHVVPPAPSRVYPQVAAHRAAERDGVTAFIDLYGPEYVRLAAKLGIPPDRINTVIAFDAATELGTKAEGSMAGTSAAVLAEIATLAADGRIHVPIAAAYPLEKVRDAFTELEQRRTFGKIVLIP